MGIFIEGMSVLAFMSKWFEINHSIDEKCWLFLHFDAAESRKKSLTIGFYGVKHSLV